MTYKRGGVYWCGFVFNGERVQRSTHQHSRRVVGLMEAAYKTALAKVRPIYLSTTLFQFLELLARTS